MVWESRKMVELGKKKNSVQSILQYEFFNQEKHMDFWESYWILKTPPIF